MADNAMELAQQMVEKCPYCGSKDFEIIGTEVKKIRCGFLLMDRKEVFRVKISCNNCSGFSGIAQGYGEVDFTAKDVALHMGLRQQAARRRRRILGLEE